MILFDVQLGKPPLDGELLFYRKEHSFDFEVVNKLILAERMGRQGVATISLGTLQIEIGIETGILLYVWGLHSIGLWEEGPVHAIERGQGMIYVRDSSIFKLGHSYDLCNGNEWKTKYDPISGWVEIGIMNKIEKGVFVEFAKNCVLQICQNHPIGLYLKPRIVT